MNYIQCHHRLKAIWQIIINIKDSSKAKAFLNFIKSLDFLTVKESDENISYPTVTEKEIIDRVAVTNKQIKQGKQFRTMIRKRIEKLVV